MPNHPIVFLFTQGGCPVCEAAIPEWERFKTRNPMQLALHLDADGPYPAHLGLKKIAATPMYVVKAENLGVIHEGLLKAEALEKWIKAAGAELEEEG